MDCRGNDCQASLRRSNEEGRKPADEHGRCRLGGADVRLRQASGIMAGACIGRNVAVRLDTRLSIPCVAVEDGDFGRGLSAVSGRWPGIERQEEVANSRKRREA